MTELLQTKDDIREVVLRYFYEAHSKSRSLRSRGLRISTVKADLKRVGLTETEIASELDYLIQTDWIVRETETYEINRSARTLPVKTDFLRISAKGIDRFDGASKFQKRHSTSGINITNIKGMVTFGDGNIVNSQFGDLYGNLSLLTEEIIKSDQVSDEEKLNYRAEIDTIKSQLSKISPDKDTIHRAWDTMKPLATVAGVAGFFERVRVLLELLLKHN